MPNLSIKPAVTVDLTRSRKQLIKPIKTSQLVVLISEDLHTSFKEKLARDKTTIRSFMTDAIEKYVG